MKKRCHSLIIVLITLITLLNNFSIVFAESTTDRCSSIPSCTLCVGYSGCGWCGSENKCIDLLMYGGAPEVYSDDYYNSICESGIIRVNPYSGLAPKCPTTYTEQASHLQTPLIPALYFFSPETCNLFNAIEKCGNHLLLGSSYWSTRYDTEYEFKGLNFLLISFAVNFYDNVKFVDRNYMLNQNDKVCLGDTIRMDSLQSYGEWFTKGGPGDSPPINWVTREEFIEIVKRVTKYFNDHYSEIKQDETQKFDPYGNGSYISAPWGEFRGELYLPSTIQSNETVLGKKITLYNSPYFVGGRVYYNWVYGALICTPNNEINSSENFSGNTIKVDSVKQLEFEVTSEPSCVFYVEKTVPAGGTKYKDNNNYIFEERQFYLLLVPAAWGKNPVINLVSSNLTAIASSDWVNNIKLTKITRTYNFQVEKMTTEPSLIVKDYSIKGDNIKLIVKNNGDVSAKIDSIQSDVPIEILGKVEIEAGKTGEVYGKLKFLSTKQSLSMSDKLEFNLIYRTDELGCLKTKEYGIRTSAIACKSNIDCGSTLNPGVCCDGLCRDSKEGVCRDENGDGIMEWIKYI